MDKITVQTYDKSADLFADYFKGIGSRVKDIDMAISLLEQPKTDIKVVEVGCGDGRDAEEIVKRAGWYEGFDPSIGLLNIARQRLPTASFMLADAETYEYPSDVDVIFAFASFLHIDKDSLRSVLKRCLNALKTKGVMYISLKEADKYFAETQSDRFGERIFYYYTVDDILGLTDKNFVPIYEDHQIISSTKWFTLAFRKD